MLATFLVEYPWAMPAVLACCVLASPFVGRWLVARRGLTGALLGVAVAVVLVLVLVPTDRELAVGCVVEWVAPLPSAVEQFANVVLFVPVAFLGALLTRRPLLAAGTGVVLSALIEVTQALLPVLGRSCSTGDWASNSIGALLGAGLAWVALVVSVRTSTAHHGRS